MFKARFLVRLLQFCVCFLLSLPKELLNCISLLRTVRKSTWVPNKCLYKKKILPLSWQNLVRGAWREIGDIFCHLPLMGHRQWLEKIEGLLHYREKKMLFCLPLLISPRTALWKLKGGELKTTMGKVVKVVNIRSHALKHKQFGTLVEEYDTHYQDLMSKCSWQQPWAFCGFAASDWSLHNRQRNQANLYYVNDEMFALDVAFLADIIKHPNSLNLKLQGNCKAIPASWIMFQPSQRSSLFIKTSLIEERHVNKHNGSSGKAFLFKLYFVLALLRFISWIGHE